MVEAKFLGEEAKRMNTALVLSLKQYSTGPNVAACNEKVQPKHETGKTGADQRIELMSSNAN